MKKSEPEPTDAAAPRCQFVSQDGVAACGVHSLHLINGADGWRCQVTEQWFPHGAALGSYAAAPGIAPREPLQAWQDEIIQARTARDEADAKLGAAEQQIRTIRQDLAQAEAETRSADELTKQKLAEIERVWQLHLSSKRRAEAAEAALASTRAALIALRDQWRNEGAQIDSFHATMGTGYKVCADQLDKLLSGLAAPQGGGLA